MDVVGFVGGPHKHLSAQDIFTYLKLYKDIFPSLGWNFYMNNSIGIIKYTQILFDTIVLVANSIKRVASSLVEYSHSGSSSEQPAHIA